MEELLEISEKLTSGVSQRFKRYLYHSIAWNNRLIGIKGARGTGKTTLALQWLNQKQLPNNVAAYFSLDDIYFTSHSLLETVVSFYQKGGKISVLDEVHKYPNWAIEIKNLYDRYQDLQIIFTGSSIIDISRQEADLSRRALIYELAGLSYREYLEFQHNLSWPVLTLEEIISPRPKLRERFAADFKPLANFQHYLKYGYYPFFTDDAESYHQRLRQIVRIIVEYDMAEVRGFDIRNARKMLQLVYVIAQQVPFKPNIKRLAEKTQIHRNSMNNYLHFLHEARLINLLYPSGLSVSTLQKPEKIFLDNPNLLFALSETSPSRGTIREVFFNNQVSLQHVVNDSKSTDFIVEGQYHFEIGGKNKSKKQIKNLSNSWVVKDDIEYPVANTIPLWLFGFLY